MPKLRVRRKGYTATRDSTSYRVKPATFTIKDRGKPGRTPKKERWYEPGVKTGWKKDMPMAQRRRLALRAHGGDKLATARSLLALHNVTTDRTTKKLSGQDASYFFALYRKEKK